MREKPGKVRVSDDGLTVELETTLQTDRVYKFSLDPIRAEDGSTMSDARAWYTLNPVEGLGRRIFDYLLSAVAKEFAMLQTLSIGPFRQSRKLDGFNALRMRSIT